MRLIQSRKDYGSVKKSKHRILKSLQSSAKRLISGDSRTSTIAGLQAQTTEISLKFRRDMQKMFYFFTLSSIPNESLHSMNHSMNLHG